jgi:hypothetical protein
MKSKRSEFLVVTDDNIKMEMHFFSDGTKGSVIRCKRSDLLKLAREVEKKSKKFKKSKKEIIRKASFFVHLCPEISFFISNH